MCQVLLCWEVNFQKVVRCWIIPVKPRWRASSPGSTRPGLRPTWVPFKLMTGGGFKPRSSKGCWMDDKGCRKTPPLGFKQHPLEDAGRFFYVHAYFGEMIQFEYVSNGLVSTTNELFLSQWLWWIWNDLMVDQTPEWYRLPIKEPNFSNGGDVGGMMYVHPWSPQHSFLFALLKSRLLSITTTGWPPKSLGWWEISPKTTSTRNLLCV